MDQNISLLESQALIFKKIQQSREKRNARRALAESGTEDLEEVEDIGDEGKDEHLFELEISAAADDEEPWSLEVCMLGPQKSSDPPDLRFLKVLAEGEHEWPDVWAMLLSQQIVTVCLGHEILVLTALVKTMMHSDNILEAHAAYEELERLYRHPVDGPGLFDGPATS